MCTLALYLGQAPGRPLVIAANRDEFLARPATEPMAVADDPWIVAGIDLEAGGTWFGLNEAGLVVGILNRRTAAAIDARRRSRGALAMDALRCRSLAEARALVAAESGAAHNPFNLLVATAAGAFVAQNHAAGVALTDLGPGLHLLTNLDLNDPTCPRIAKSHQLFEAVRPQLERAALPELIAHLRPILADHSTPLDPRGGTGGGPSENLCVHLGSYGTRSSSIAVHDGRRGRLRLFHAPGPPCTHDYREVPLPGESPAAL